MVEERDHHRYKSSFGQIVASFGFVCENKTAEKRNARGAFKSKQRSLPGANFGQIAFSLR